MGAEHDPKDEQAEGKPAVSDSSDPEETQQQGLAQPGPPTDPQNPTG